MIIGINATYLAKKNKTGIENYASMLILKLLEQDKANTYRLFSPIHIDRSLLPKHANYSLHISPFPRGWHRFRLPLSLLRHKVDLFFDPGYTIPPFISVPSIITIHDLAHKYFPQAYTASQISNLERTFKLAERKAAGLIFTSQNTQNDFFKFYPGAKAQSAVIYQGYNKNEFIPGKQRDILKLEVPYILFVGRLERRKNVVNLIRAYVKMRHVNPELKHKLVLVGKESFGWDEIKKEIEINQKFGQDIIHIGYASASELPNLYACADLFVYPSLYEGFGIPILEAFASQTPVAAANTSSIPEVGGEAIYYFDPRSTDDIARVLAVAVKDKNGRKLKVAAGAKRLAEFSWEAYVTDFLSLAEKILHENRNNP